MLICLGVKLGLQFAVAVVSEAEIISSPCFCLSYCIYVLLETVKIGSEACCSFSCNFPFLYRNLTDVGEVCKEGNTL